MTTLKTTVISLHNQLFFKIFTWFTRILLAVAFVPSGLTKLVGNRFTTLGTDDPVGFFFEALYQSGWYWNFIGLLQLTVVLLLLIPKTTFLGALLYLPIVINILAIVTSMHFTGTPFIVGLMLLANIYLLIWDVEKLHAIGNIILKR
ncbi:DoxX family membrane protein [Bizionia psychrotolerans]|uniref:DoxX family membrane protein n=1 Tax=Bizionia psychrotolerans TaxID=1492901 RepID=UPI00069D454E|nr:DoxX family membrane protein [Bizionia psychrotolerans]